MRGPVTFWWLSQTIRFLLLLVLLLSTVVYFLSLLDVSLLRSYIHPKNATKSIYSKTSSLWSQKWPTEANFEVKNVTYNRTTFNKESNQINSTNKNVVIATKNVAKEYTAPFVAIKTETRVNKTIKKRVLKTNKAPLPLCPEVPPGLGPIEVNKTELYLDDIEKKIPEVKLGGQYTPPNCTARHKVAIIVPYRDRDQHLRIFVNYMHPFLMKQQLEYGIFIIEQYRYKSFNRAKLMNVGFVESQKQKAGGWQCFIFHDIDLLPLDQRNLYQCQKDPLHMSVLIDKFNYKVQNVFGGVSAMTLEQFTKVNGYSNRYWGWGAEDDDMFRRVQKVFYGFTRYADLVITKYIMLDHEQSFKNPFRLELLSQTCKTMDKDGLSSLNYEVVSLVKHHLYTLITVDIDKPTAHSSDTVPKGRRNANDIP
ncbi:PREDICTED: beta-1,4-galactosyltransferase 2-like [Papilio xuthus]|uniref:Beta-1,4-N-acetylgalactosaminyltransferase n=1 Tax=Papilio xuthus TaxID=66420 RepID=A0AAJ7EJL1_PAPXU|nr:PREDICTED: beta-1,4-galactosyltransferase 2-like [Papilio xuthus]